MPKYLKYGLAIIKLNDKLYILNKTIPNIMHEHCHMSTVIEILCYSFKLRSRADHMFRV